MSDIILQVEEPIFINVERTCANIIVDGDGGGNIDTALFVINEVPNGVLNGVNTIFTTDFNFIPESVEVYVNGVKQKLIQDYNTSGTNTITLTFSPSSTEYILLNYIKQ